MNLNQSTLVLFEKARKSLNVIPPQGSNSFYKIGDGQINLLTKRNDPDNYRFELFTDSGEVLIGDSAFNIAGDIENIEFPYENLTVIKNTAIVISNVFGVSKGLLDVYGIVRITDKGCINIRNSGRVILHKDSDLIIDTSVGLQIDDGCSMTIYGRIHVNVDSVDTILNTPGILIDPSAILDVTGLETLGQRLFSLTDYFSELSKQIININTQGEKNFIRGIGRIGYQWKYGDPLKRYQVLQLSVLYGKAILGDFKLSILGRPKDPIKDYQLINTLIIANDSELHVTEQFNEFKYIHPELFIGSVIGNCMAPGECIVRGKMYVCGKNSLITMDRGGKLTVEESAELYVCDSAMIRSTNNGTSQVLFINGTLIIDSIEQISSFVKQNIVFGDNGKLVVQNPDNGERRVLFSTPNGIKDSELYRLFYGRLDKIEYHISNNTGIKIDQYYEYFHKDFISWYNDMPIGKAIHDGLIVWHDGGFINLSNSIIPWVNSECTLLDAARIFRTIGSSNAEKLQDSVNKLKYAGSGNIVLIFEYNETSHEVTLILDDVHITNTINNPLSNAYMISTDNSGELFMRNNLSVVSPETIIAKESTVIPIEDDITNVVLP